MVPLLVLLTAVLKLFVQVFAKPDDNTITFLFTIFLNPKTFFSFKFWIPVCLYGILLRAWPPIKYISHPIHHLIIKLWVLLVVQYSCIGLFGEERTSWTTIDTLYITVTHKQSRVIWPFNFILIGQCKEGQKTVREEREEQGQENTLSIYCISVIRKVLGQPCTFRGWASSSSDSLNSTHTAMFLAWDT